MFKRIRQLASGRGQVAYSDAALTHEFLVTEWVEAIDRFTLVERFPYGDTSDKVACAWMVRGFVDTYAEAN